MAFLVAGWATSDEQVKTFRNRDLGGGTCMERLLARVSELSAERRAELEAGVAGGIVARRLEEALAEYARRVADIALNVVTMEDDGQALEDAKKLGVVSEETLPTLLAMRRLWRIHESTPETMRCFMGEMSNAFWLPSAVEARFMAHLYDCTLTVAVPPWPTGVSGDFNQDWVSIEESTLRPEDLEPDTELARAAAKASSEGKPLVVDFYERPISPSDLPPQADGKAMAARLGQKAEVATVDMNLDRCGPASRLALRLRNKYRTIAVFDSESRLLDRIDGYPSREQVLLELDRILAGETEVQRLARKDRSPADRLRFAALLVSEARVDESRQELERILDDDAGKNSTEAVDAMLYLGLMAAARGSFGEAERRLAQYLSLQPEGGGSAAAHKVFAAIAGTAR